MTNVVSATSCSDGFAVDMYKHKILLAVVSHLEWSTGLAYKEQCCYLSHCEPYFLAWADWLGQKIYELSRKCSSEWLPALNSTLTLHFPQLDAFHNNAHNACSGVYHGTNRSKSTAMKQLFVMLKILCQWVVSFVQFFCSIFLLLCIQSCFPKLFLIDNHDQQFEEI